MAYCSPIGDITPPEVNLNGYTDDHSIRKAFNQNIREDEQHTVLTLQKAISNMAD